MGFTRDYTGNSTADWTFAGTDFNLGGTSENDLNTLVYSNSGIVCDMNLAQAIIAGIVLGVMIFMTISGNVLVLLTVFVN